MNGRHRSAGFSCCLHSGALWATRYFLAFLLLGFSSVVTAVVDLNDLTPAGSSVIQVDIQYQSFNRRNGIASYQATLTNVSSEAQGGPVHLAVDGITSPDVSVANADDSSTSGLPLFLFDTPSLGVGESISRVIQFNNPSRVRFNFTSLVFTTPIADTTPPTISIDSPSDGAVVSDASLLVSGTAGDNVEVAGVTVNGVNASLSGTQFSATIGLSEGANTVTAVATDAAGNTASTSIQVALDTGAPDTTGPQLNIIRPNDGGLVIVARPLIQLSFNDPSGVDTSTLALLLDGQPLGVDCVFGTDSADCTPTADIPDGQHTVNAELSDALGNASMAQAGFLADTVPVAIDITSPIDGLITKDAQLAVAGTVGAGVQSVDVNGVAAVVGGASFSANVPLREGTNMIVAVGTKAGGRTGTDSVDVTRDIFAPIVRITSPREGFVSVNDTVAVTGQVNDVVNGATNARVLVNGVEATVAAGSFMVIDIPLVRGPNTIEAVATDAVGNEGRHSINVNFQPPAGARVAVNAGNGQVGSVNEALAAPLVVQVTDNLGNPVAGRVVTFDVTRNNGLLQAQAADTPQRMIQIPSDGSGLASALFTLGDTSGEGNNRVRATALGAAGEVEFCATGAPAPVADVLAVMGENQRGLVGNPLAIPLEVLVVDDAGNSIPGAQVTFAVAGGDGNLNGTSSAQRISGTDGIARIVLTLGPDPGINNNVVNATVAGLADRSAIFFASGLEPGNPADTKFSGVVLDNGHTPIPGAVVSILDDGSVTPATTDAEGLFLLENVPVGQIHLNIDPSGSPRPETFPSLQFETVTVAGQVNILGQPILLPALQTDSSKVVGGNAAVTISMPGVAGLELTVFPNSATFPGGARTGQLTISQVHLDKVPMPPPSGTIFMPPAWTIQPAGVIFDPPARISIPNDGLPPGRVIDIFQFDHTLNEFINVGKGTVSEDGSVIVSDPGFGITRAGWGGCGNPPPPNDCKNKKCKDPDPDDCVVVSGNTCDPGGCKKTNKAECATCGKDKMSACTKDGKCIDFPTVALSFRNSGALSADNSVNIASITTLGLVVAGTRFRNVMELEGTISPSKFTCASYDFKRILKTDAELFVNGVKTVIRAAGASDDSHNTDEDLTPKNDHIYSVDGPSPGIGPNSAGSNGDTRALRAKFTEWVECKVKGKTKKCSSDFDWCFVMSFKHSGGNWVRDGANNVQSGTGCY